MADRLADYREKRDLSRSPEPKGRKKRGKGRRYAIQKHDASSLHYDLRLEHDGALLSWAITKGPHLKPGERRLAMRTEDHPVDYAGFEGVIPEGYGAGTVMLWDEGEWEPLDDPDEGLDKGRIRFALKGERLEGEWTLARMDDGDGKWLLMKRKDDAAEDVDPTRRWTDSVATGRKMDEIAEKGERLDTDEDDDGGSGDPGDAAPDFIEPMLATLVDDAPAGKEWGHEIKHDGYRIIAVVKDGEAKLLTRSGQDWTERFGDLHKGFEDLAKNAVFDVEAVAAAEDARSDFSALQRAVSEGREVHAVAFDLLNLDGEDLREKPLSERRERLRKLIGRRRKPVRFGREIDGDGNAALEAACRMGAEGLVSKRRDSTYRSTRSRDWLKSKCEQSSEAVVGGWRDSDKDRPFRSLLLGTFEDGRFVYRGRVGTGFDQDDFEALMPRLKRLERKTPPFDETPADAGRQAHWVTPEIVVQLRYTEMTEDGAYRHPTYLGLREDKPAKEVSADVPGSNTSPEISNRDKTLYPEAGVSKGEVADYLAEMAEPILRFAAGRPLTLVRCPDGIGDDCFFQKRPLKGMPDAIRVWRRDGEDWLAIDDEAGLLACAQLGALELHIGGARTDDPGHPERLVFDLDPGEGVDFAEVRRAARAVGDALRDAGLTPFPLLTGGSGVHVVAPLKPDADWDTVRRFARRLAKAMASAEPDRYVATASKEKREGKVFIDWLRNGDGQTAICPLSPRAKKGAPVAAPVDWPALGRADDGNAYDLTGIRRRLAQTDGEPWDGYEARRAAITEDMADEADDLA